VYTSPRTFTLKQRAILRAAVPTAAGALKLLCASCRTECFQHENLEAVLHKHGHAIMAIWHESMGVAAWLYRGTGSHTLTSFSFDGEIAARVVRHFGLFAVRGSSSRGGSEALESLVRAVQAVEMVGFTLDGPKGPRRKAKPGIAILAARTATPIVPHAIAVHPCWRLRSWDRLAVPKPFARIVSAYGPAIEPPADDSPEAVEATRARVEAELNGLHTIVEANAGASSV
jgi:lysophospholipid acyltransferase (LPLAT)-like uncharacterized protein